MQHLIEIEINSEQINALQEWKPLLKNAIDDFELKAYPEDYDYYISPPEVVEEQKFLRSRINLMKTLISHIDNVLSEFGWDDDDKEDE